MIESLTVQSCPNCRVDLTEFGKLIKLAFCPRCQHPVMLLANKYQIQKVMAEGGFGKVYLAKRIQLKRDAERVVKVIKPEVLSLAGMEERFWREVQITSALSQRSLHIVRIYDDFGHEPGLGHYYVMEFLRGSPLKDLMKHGIAFPPRVAIHMFTQICDGLRVAHREGVIHRDLKPDNLFVLPQDDGTYFLKIIDWGIAKPTDWSSIQQDLTQGAVGTPRYMAPEQCLGQAVDARTDIYAMGAILYEMLTGCPIFPLPEGTGNAPLLALLHAHVSEKPTPLRQRRPDIKLPEGLEQAVLKALHKNPADRYQSIEEFSDIVASCDEKEKTRLELTGLPTTSSAAFSPTMLAALESAGLAVPKAKPETANLPDEPPKGGIFAADLSITSAAIFPPNDPTHSPTQSAQHAKPSISKTPPSEVPANLSSASQANPLGITPSQIIPSAPSLQMDRPSATHSTTKGMLIGIVLTLLAVFVGFWAMRAWNKTTQTSITPRTTVPSKAITKAPIPPVQRRTEPSTPTPPRPPSTPPHQPPPNDTGQGIAPTPRPKRKHRKRRPAPRRRVSSVRSITPKRPTPEGPCPSSDAQLHWIQAHLRTPRGRTPKLQCPGASVTFQRGKGVWCIGIATRRLLQCTLKIPKYQPCDHTLSKTYRRIAWTMELEDPNAMMGENKCFSILAKTR